MATKVRKRDRDAGLAELNQSFINLKTEKIDLLQVHNLVGIEQMLPIIREWKQEGRIRYLGVSTSSDRQYPAFIEMMKKETLDFIQVDYSMVNRSAADQILPLAKDRGMGVLINLPYARGRVFERVGDRVLPDWTSEFDVNSWGQFYLKYILSHPSVTCVIPGTATIKYLADNLGAARGRMPDGAMRKRMEQFFDGLPS